ncbi:hypothetical protein D3C86_1436900 [compost metagenome]
MQDPGALHVIVIAKYDYRGCGSDGSCDNASNYPRGYGRFGTSKKLFQEKVCDFSDRKACFNQMRIQPIYV